MKPENCRPRGSSFSPFNFSLSVGWHGYPSCLVTSRERIESRRAASRFAPRKWLRVRWIVLARCNTLIRVTALRLTWRWWWGRECGWGGVLKACWIVRFLGFCGGTWTTLVELKLKQQAESSGWTFFFRPFSGGLEFDKFEGHFML